MNTLLLAGGQGQRFKDAGYTIPKVLLPLHDGKPVLEWIRARLPNGPVTAVFSSSLPAVQLEPYTKGWNTVYVDGTAGPIGSAYKAMPHLQEGPLLVVYCDSLAKYRLFSSAAQLQRAETAAIIFRSSNPRFGYWTGQSVVEKKTVSPWAVAGVFFFSSLKLFIDRCRAYTLSDGIPSLLDNRTRMYQLAVADVGTPVDYEEFLQEDPEWLNLL